MTYNKMNGKLIMARGIAFDCSNISSFSDLKVAELMKLVHLMSDLIMKTFCIK